MSIKDTIIETSEPFLLDAPSAEERDQEPKSQEQEQEKLDRIKEGIGELLESKDELLIETWKALEKSDSPKVKEFLKKIIGSE